MCNAAPKKRVVPEAEALLCAALEWYEKARRVPRTSLGRDRSNAGSVSRGAGR